MRAATRQARTVFNRRWIHHGSKQTLALLWILNLSDGSHSLLDIAERADIPFDKIYEASLRLEGQGLIK